MTRLNTDLSLMTATDLLQAFSSGTASPVSAIDRIWLRYEALGHRINAFSEIHFEQARAQALLSEERWAEGSARPLEGIPITIKDSYDVTGMSTSQDSLAFSPYRANRDNPVVERLKEAGGIILGKTTMSEFAWSGISRNPRTGITHNPWKHGYNAGASSAGASAAAAAGLGTLHLGSDGAGSIRLPAHFCGVFGMKPTYGRVPQIPVSNNDYGTHVGPITRSVRDAALMLEVMSGAHPLDRTSLERPPEPYSENLAIGSSTQTLAFSMDLGHAVVDSEIKEIITNAISLLRSELGWVIQDVSPEWGAVGCDLGRFFWTSLQSKFLPLIEQYESVMSPDFVACAKEAVAVTVSKYHLQREAKNDYTRRIETSLQQWQFLLTPVASVAAFPADRVLPEHWPQHNWDWLSWCEFMYPFNMSGNPAASIPCGRTRDGLPVGIQIVGRRFDDKGVLQISAAMEKVLPRIDYSEIKESSGVATGTK